MIGGISGSQAARVDDGFRYGFPISEGDFLVKTLTSDDEKTKAYHLRHRIFCEELGWVPRSESMLEIDEYDKYTISIGVFDQKHVLIACTRLALPGTPFMIEKDFSSLISPLHEIRKHDDTTEVSRTCVAPEARRLSVRGTFGVFRVSMLGYKGVYQLCSLNNLRYVYTVVEPRLYRTLRAQGFQTHTGRRACDHARWMRGAGGNSRLAGIFLRERPEAARIRGMVHYRPISPASRATATA
jgi:acyl homoserine lactone synthase